MVIGDVSNLPMYYCNTCGNDTLDISDLRLTASHHMILDIDYVLKIGFYLLRCLNLSKKTKFPYSQWEIQNTT